jgi:hypothetical protein
MKHTTKPRYKFHAVKWTKKEKFEVKIEEKSWKDLNQHTPSLAQPSVWNDIAMAMHGGKDSNYLTDIANTI